MLAERVEPDLGHSAGLIWTNLALTRWFAPERSENCALAAGR